MTDQEIRFLLSDENNEVLDAHKKIVSIQKDKSSILKFGKEWQDKNLVGGINNKILMYGSRPGGGKTYHCSETINALLNRDLNPTDVKTLRINLEMPTQTLLLQQICRTLGKTPNEVLEKPYSDAERPIVTKIVQAFTDPRIKNISKVLVGDDFRKLISNFIADIDLVDNERINRELKLLLTGEEEKDEEIKRNFTPEKTKKVVLIDHLHIYKNKEEIDNILLICNEMKMKDKNLSFIIYFQLRRDVEEMWRDSKDKKINPKNMLPNATYIYQTDLLQQLADIVVGMVIPQIYEADLFAAVHKERNEHLKEHFAEESSDANYTRLKGRNRIYYNFMKIRLLNSFDDPRLFCEILNPDYEEKANKIMEENTKPFNGIPLFNKTPVFDSLPTQTLVSEFKEKPLPTVSLKDAFGSSFCEKKDGEPF